MAIIAPSILACDFLHLQKTCDSMKDAGASWLHLDIMDGRFVPNISFGVPIVSAINRATNMWLDVHLMIVEPRKYINAFHHAGANSIAIHIEASDNAKKDLNLITQLKIKPAIAINPDTNVARITELLPLCHHVCLMSVFPGFGGRQFIESSIEKISELKATITKKKLPTLIQADGGITLENASAVVDAGADILVAGNAIFKSNTPKEITGALKRM